MQDKPLTKECLADILSVSLRTIGNWMTDGTLPAWHYIGRRPYWHPEVIRAWLAARLNPTGVTVMPPSLAAPATPRLPAERRRGRPKRSGRPSPV